MKKIQIIKLQNIHKINILKNQIQSSIMGKACQCNDSLCGEDREYDLDLEPETVPVV